MDNAMDGTMKLEFTEYDGGGGSMMEETMDESVASKYAVVFLVEATGKLNRHMQRLKASYLLPILSYFRNINKNTESEMSSVGWPKDVWYGFVFCYSGDASTGQETYTGFQPTENEEYALSQFDKIPEDFSSFISSPQICVLEALSSGIEYMHHMIAKHLPDQHVQKHFILVGQSSPFDEAVPTNQLRPQNFLDAASLLLEEQIHFSVIFTRKNKSIKEFFTSSQDPTSFIEIVESDSSSMVLLNNISIRPMEDAPKLSPKLSPEIINQQILVNQIAEITSLPESIVVPPSSQESSVVPVVQTQTMEIISAVGQDELSNFLNRENASTPGIISRVSQSPLTTDVSSPSISVFSPANIDLSSIPIKNSESPKPVVTVHHRASPQIVNVSQINSTSVAQPVFYPSQPRFPIPVPQVVAARMGGPANKPPSVSVNQIAQDASANRNPRLTGIPDLRGISGQANSGVQRLSNSPLNPAQIAQMNGLRIVGEKCIVWEGLLEWSIPNSGRARTMPPNQQLSEMWVAATDVIKAERWPNKLTIQFLPHNFTSMIQPFMVEPIKVSFTLKPQIGGSDAAIRELIDHFTVKRTPPTHGVGCILVQNSPMNPLIVTGISKGEPATLELRVIVFVFNPSVGSFQGFIPREQVGFVDVLRQLTQSTSAANRQRQMVQQNQNQNQNQQAQLMQNNNLQQQNPGSLQRSMQFGSNPNLMAADLDSQYGMMQQQPQINNQPGQNLLYNNVAGSQTQQLTPEQSMRMQQTQQQHQMRLQMLQQQQQQQSMSQQQQLGQIQQLGVPDPQLRQLLQNTTNRLHGGPM